MSGFDFFGTEESAGDADSEGNLELSFEFDHENLPADGRDKDVKLCVSVRPSDDLRRSFEKEGGNQEAHICLVIDISGSMASPVDSSGTTRLYIAINSAKKVVNLMRPGDTLSCVAYNGSVRTVFKNLTASDAGRIIRGLDSINQPNGRTDVAAALEAAGNMLSAFNDAKPKRILFFTDGVPTDPVEWSIDVSGKLAAQGITIESMGFGNEEVNFPYLQKISSASGGVAALINYPDEFVAIFRSLFVKSQSTVATGAKLILNLIGDTRVYDYYRGTPDNVYLGNADGCARCSLEINVGQIEKNQMYKYYFNVKLPGVSGYEGMISTMRAELHYHIPGKNNDRELTIRRDVPVNYTSDEEETAQINGNVNVLFRLAEVKRFDEERERAYNAGDAEAVIGWIRRIITVYTELQKPVEAQAYTDMLEEYMGTHKITRAVLNKATSSSSQAQETGLLEDLDDDEAAEFANRLKRRRKH